MNSFGPRGAYLIFLCAVLAAHSAVAVYLPGVAPMDYAKGDPVELKVNSLVSAKTQMPFEYYKLPFCRPESGSPIQSPENLGEYLSGDRIESSPYDIRMREAASCKILCQKSLSEEDKNLFKKRIKEEYRVNLLVDNLPAFTKQTFETANGEVEVYDIGFPLGFVGNGDFGENEEVYIFNHLKFLIHSHALEELQLYRVVGFEVDYYSVKHTYTEWTGMNTMLTSCHLAGKKAFQSVSSQDGNEIIFTYDVVWLDSEVKWASRWDVYLKMKDSQIHWFSIVNSLMMVIFLSTMVAMIMLRTLHRDISRYNSDPSEESQIEETGWKLVHGDVFRTPAYSALLSTLVGTGCQVMGMGFTTMAFALFGFVSPATRGGLMNAILLMYVFMGYFAGYVSDRMYSMFGLQNRNKNTFITAFAFPALNFSVFLFLNTILWSQGSSGAIPFLELFALLVLWIGISVPLVYLGSFVSHKRPPLSAPIKVNLIPRVIPPQAWYMGKWLSVLLGGLIPFGAVFIEVFFIMSSIWLHRFYYVFGFLFLVFVILIVTCAEISIVMCYFQLCSEDYNWWWRSYLTSGSSAFYLFAYSILYFVTKLDITKFISGVLFFGYMSLICLFFFVLTGTVGFLATLFFVRRIYSAVKLE